MYTEPCADCARLQEEYLDAVVEFLKAKSDYQIATIEQRQAGQTEIELRKSQAQRRYEAAREAFKNHQKQHQQY